MLKLSLLCTLGLAALPATAFEFPAVNNPVVQGFFAQYEKDRASFSNPAMYKVPDPLPAWTCEVNEEERHKMAGTSVTDPEMAKKIQKDVRKMLRQSGMGSDAVGQTAYSKVVQVLISGDCSSGKLSGPAEVLGGYVSVMTSGQSMAIGEKTVKMSSETTMDMKVRSRFSAVDGKLDTTKPLATFTLASSKMSMHYDDAAMDKMMKDINSKPPTSNLIVSYTAPDGTMVMFTEIDSVSLSKGFLGPSVNTTKELQTTIMTKVSEQVLTWESYTGKRLVSRSSMKNGKPHGEQVMYMDNVAKNLGQKLESMPGMGDAKEVVIDGRDMLETRTCYQDGQQVKMSPCPAL